MSKSADKDGQNVRTPLPPFDLLNRYVLNQVLDPQQGPPYGARAVIRSQLGLAAETNAPVTPVPVPAAPDLTNTPAINPR